MCITWNGGPIFHGFKYRTSKKDNDASIGNINESFNPETQAYFNFSYLKMSTKYYTF